MIKLIKRVSNRAVSPVLLITLLMVTLVACGNPDPNTIVPAITLTVDKVDLPDGGGNVMLTAKVTNRGAVTSVIFKATKGAEIAPVTEPNEKGDYVTTVRVAETTTFTAEATGPAGTGKSPAEGTTVAVAPVDPINNPKAPPSSAAVKGFTKMTLTTGAPSGLSVIVSEIPGVTGAIDGQVVAETVTSKEGRSVVIEAGDGVLSFTYPASPSVIKDSFEYTVTKTGRTAKGKIDIDIQNVPSSVEVIEGNDGVNDINNTGDPLILLTKDVRCTSATGRSDSCIQINAGQTLAGAAVIDGVVVKNSVKPKIIANLPNTRKSGTASCGTVDDFIEDNGGVFPPDEYNPRDKNECIETKVILLADNSAVEGIEITSDSTDEATSYFVALYARGDRPVESTDNVLDGDIFIKDVTINRSNGKPIYIQYTFPNISDPTPTLPVYGNYNLTIDGLDLNDANDTLVIGNPKKLVFKNSDIELLQPSGNNAGPQEFGDNSGVQIANYNDGGDITIDDVDVYMESPAYRIDFGAVGNNCTSIEIYNDNFFVRDSSGDPTTLTTEVTVKNSDVTFGTSNDDVRAFKVRSFGGIVNIGSGSTNNKSVRGVLLDRQARNGIAGTINGNVIVTP
jgi:hypothetical protein